jgi:cytochrome c biogenesis factor
MQFLYKKILLVVTVLICLLLAVIVIAHYSRSAAVLIWLLGNCSLRAVKLIKVEKLNHPQIQKLDILDTEYAAIVAASRNDTGDDLFNPQLLISDIIRYRQSTRASVKDSFLYRMGVCLRIFSAQDRENFKRQNCKLTDEQRQQVIHILSERFGVFL